MASDATWMLKPVVARWRRLEPFWRRQLLGWALFAVVDLINRWVASHSFLQSLVLTLFSYPLLLLLSAALRRILDRGFADSRPSPRAVAALVVLSWAAAAVMVSAVTVVRRAAGWNIPHWRPLEQVGLPLLYFALVFLAWGILYFWTRAERARRLDQSRMVAAQMDALRAEIRQLQLQLDPHFLFNALNGLAEEVPEHPEAALAMIRDLTQYLRHQLAGIRAPVVTMGQEAEALAAYLRIQQARFGPKVRARLSVEPLAAERSIANLLLQPLVENAFEHGDRSAVLDILIKVATDGDALTIEIANSGRLAPSGGRGHHGIGLENVRRRLDVHYPGRHSFALQEATGEGRGPRVVASLRLEGEPCCVS